MPKCSGSWGPCKDVPPSMSANPHSFVHIWKGKLSNLAWACICSDISRSTVLVGFSSKWEGQLSAECTRVGHGSWQVGAEWEPFPNCSVWGFTRLSTPSEALSLPSIQFSIILRNKLWSVTEMTLNVSLNFTKSWVSFCL